MRALAAVLIFCAALADSAYAIELKKEAQRKRAPAFELPDQNGATVRLADMRGKVVLVDFWATWCGPCRESIPWFNEFAAKYGAEGFAILGISMDQDGWAAVKPFMEKMRVAYPVLLGNKRVKYLYGDVEELPLAFFIDRAGRVAAIHPGAGSRKNYEKTIKSLLAEPTPAH